MTTRNMHDLLDDYVLDMLTPAERKEFEDHLSTCLACSQELKNLDDLKSKISGLPAGIPPRRDLWAGVEKAISDPKSSLKETVSAESHQPPSKWSDGLSVRPILSIFTNPYYRAAAVLVILLGTAVVWILMRNHGETPDTLQVHEIPKSEKKVTEELRPGPADSSRQKTSGGSNASASGDRTRIGKAPAGVRFSESLTSESNQAGSSVASADGEGSTLGRLHTSFVNYTAHLPNDRIYLQFDKPFYKPGETIWFRAYVRDEENFAPSRQSDVLYVQLITPKGNRERELTLLAKDGVASGDIDLDENLPGGIYKIKAFTKWQMNSADPFFFEKELQVQNVVLPHLKLKLDFERKAFGPGDNVVAKFEAASLQNKSLANVEFTYVVNIDGKSILERTERTDRSGTTYVAFDLPKNITSTDGLLGIMIAYEGQTESITRSIPIVLNKIRLAMYPEGGDLVDGLSSRVAVQALNEFDKPADVEGVVLDDQNRSVARFASYHLGMGAFTLTPEAGRQYHAIITKPEGVSGAFDVPKSLEHGTTLALQRGSRGELEFLVGAQSNGEMEIVCQSRGKIAFTKHFSVHTGITTIPFPTNDLSAGVVQATLFDANGVEQAERLVFVNKNRMMKVELSTDKEKYLPREKVTLAIKATDGRDKAASGDLSLAVADDKLISFADDKSGNIVAKMLLEPDLKGKVDEPNFYFDPKEPKADTALDYLMMTRGWRRFTWKEVMADQPPQTLYHPEWSMIAGTVLGGNDGKPVEGAIVSLVGTDSLTTTTDSAGHFRLRYVNITSPTPLEVTKKGFESYELTTSEYSENLTCELWKKGTAAQVVGRIFDRTSKAPVRGAIVSVIGTELSAATDGQGIYTIAPLRTGTYTVQIKAPGYQVVEHHNVRIGAPKTVVDIGIDLLPPRVQGQSRAEVQKPVMEKDAMAGVGHATGRIMGKVLEAGSGQPIAGITVLVEGTVRGAATDTAGRYTIVGVPIGTYALRVNGVGFEALEVRGVQVDPNATTNVNYSLEPSAVQMNMVQVTAEMPMIQRNFTNTVDTRNEVATEGKNAANPKNVNDVLKLQNGVVKEANNLFLRGGRGNEAQYLVDGIPTNDVAGAGGLAAGGKNGELKKYNQGYARGLIGKPPAIGFGAKIPNDQGAGVASKKQVTRFYRAREFPAPVYQENQKPDVRTDFRSTIFWKGDVALDRSGKATVTFYNSDEVTSFRATVEGISSTGLVGRTEKAYYTQLPFSLAAKAPVEVSMGDRVLVPLTLKNNTSRTVSGKLSITSPDNWRLAGQTGDAQSIAAGSSATLFVPFDVLDKPGPGMMEIAFESEGLSDAFRQEVFVREKGFPQMLSAASGDQDKTYTFVLNHPIPGTVKARVSAYPTVASNLLTAVDAMLQEPGGCFEQSSSTNYPNALALRYLQETGTINPELKARADRLLDVGYKHLTTFETKNKGYEWFGSTPPNEALTAYGLMEFKDMQPVYASLDNSMVQRTAGWLISRRDGNGGFKRDPKALDSFGGASPEVTNAYIVFALASAGYHDIKPELDAVYRSVSDSRDPYQLALVANAMLSVGETDRAGTLISALLKVQKEDGSWDGTTHSITRSTGQSLRLETTSLVILALLKSGNPDPASLNQGVKFLLASRSGRGMFGSTQSTILTLKALTEYTKYSKRAAEPGEIEIRLDGARISRASYAAGEAGPIVADSLEKYIATDDKAHSLRVSMLGTKHPLPHAVVVSWNTSLPISDDSSKVAVSVNLAEKSVRMGGTVRLSADLRNRTNEGLPMTLALVGIPGGLSAQPWQLKELQEKGVFDFYEIRGRYIAFYYRQMKPTEERVIDLDLKAEIPGTYESPASSAYLYYTNEYKSWSSAGSVEVTP